MDTTSRWRRYFLPVFGIIAISFLATTVFTNWRLLAIDRASIDIASNAAPSIEDLAAARGELHQLEPLMSGYLQQ